MARSWSEELLRTEQNSSVKSGFLEISGISCGVVWRAEEGISAGLEGGLEKGGSVERERLGGRERLNGAGEVFGAG